MKRDVVIGFVVLALLLGGVYLLRKPTKETESEPFGTSLAEVEQKLEEKFNFDVPETAEKISLRDVSGGQASALVTRDVGEEGIEITVLADLPELEDGKQYQAWLVRGVSGEEDFAQISLGLLGQAKGGWILEFSSGENYETYGEVIVSLEAVVDGDVEDVLLEGMF